MVSLVPVVRPLLAASVLPSLDDHETCWSWASTLQILPSLFPLHVFLDPGYSLQRFSFSSRIRCMCLSVIDEI